MNAAPSSFFPWVLIAERDIDGVEHQFGSALPVMSPWCRCLLYQFTLAYTPLPAQTLAPSTDPVPTSQKPTLRFLLALAQCADTSELPLNQPSSLLFAAQTFFTLSVLSNLLCGWILPIVWNHWRLLLCSYTGSRCLLSVDKKKPPNNLFSEPS